MSEAFDTDTGEVLPLPEYHRPLNPPIYRRSADTAELFAALAKAQGDIAAAPRVRPNAHFNAKYAGLDSVIEVSRKPLAANGLAVIQIPTNAGENGENVSITTLLSHASGQWLEATLSVKPARWDAQGMGSAITYLRRYTLMSIIGIAPEDDDGEAAVGRGSSSDGEATVGRPTATRATPAVRRDNRNQARAAYRVVQNAIDGSSTPESLREIYDTVLGEWGALYADEIDTIRNAAPDSLPVLITRVNNRLHTLTTEPQTDAFGLAPLPDQPLSGQQQLPPAADAGPSLAVGASTAGGAEDATRRRVPRTGAANE